MELKSKVKKLYFIINLYELNSSGKLVLNRTNIEKSALYLNPKTFLSNITGKRKLTESELKGIHCNNII